MQNIGTYDSKTIPNHQIKYLSYNNITYLSSSNNYDNKCRTKNNLSSNVKTLNLKSDNKKRPNNIYLSYNHNFLTLNNNTVNRTNSNSCHNKDLKTNQINYNNDSKIIISNHKKENKYSNISNIQKKIYGLNIRQIIPNTKTIKINSSPKKIFADKINNLQKVKNFSFKDLSNPRNLNSSNQRHNHSFFEVKSLTNDFGNHKKNKLTIKINNNNGNSNYLYPEKTMEINSAKDNKINNKNRLLNINYNINNNINLIINSKKIKYIKKKGETIFNNKKINIKNINSSKLIKYNNKRNGLESLKINKYKLNKINCSFFSYIPKQKTIIQSSEKKPNKVKKYKKMSNENKLILKNLNCKSFEEDFPIKIKYNRNYRVNKRLKPQIALRLTLFKVSKIEIERYFIMNFFYSENLRVSEKKNISEFYFLK